MDLYEFTFCKTSNKRYFASNNRNRLGIISISTGPSCWRVYRGRQSEEPAKFAQCHWFWTQGHAFLSRILEASEKNSRQIRMDRNWTMLRTRLDWHRFTMLFKQSYQLLNPIALNHLHNVISDPQPFLIHQKRRLDFLWNAGTIWELSVISSQNHHIIICHLCKM